MIGSPVEYHDCVVSSPNTQQNTGAGFYATEATAPSATDATAVLHRAVELGITFINTANLYGPFVNEELIGARRTAPC